jgi:hypothetical protein
MWKACAGELSEHRLAGGINDERTAQALRAHAADLFDQIKIVEQQQSQKSAPKDVD